MKYFAHVRQLTAGKEKWEEHYLEEHLRAVASRAAQFAMPFGSGDWAELAGLWHDLGKYQQGFQKHIRTASGYEAEAHIETAPGRIDHSTAGAIHACQRFGLKGRILAYLIAGHHTGLLDWQSDTAGQKALIQRLEKQQLLDATLTQTPPVQILQAAPPTSQPKKGTDPALWIRMLFSCLVDADFLDTEAFMDPGKAAERAGYPPLTELSRHFNSHMEKLKAEADDTRVNRLRRKILDRCEKQATQSPGLFSLTVPTGGGKTLSSLAFALRHALEYGKNRIIYVIPYTSIIEQTADTFRAIFGDAVLEHHSNLDGNQETARSRLACENWDAPIIVTTAVQFFESLFASRTSRTRKLHNIVDSVVVLDEAQLLPPDFLNPILQVIEQLKDFYGVSFLLCTATQPALYPQSSFGWRFKGLNGIREIMEDPASLHDALRRVEIRIPENLQISVTWEELAEKLQTHESVLCIVDRRDDCRTLRRLMAEGTWHLSGLMCGQHRSQVINEIKRRLKAGEALRVISTQLVEAGVDVDFPVVYRALAGLDSIAQAAGRCNREGLLDGLGQVVVFVPPKPAPVGHLRQAQDCGRQMLQQRFADPLAPDNFKTYFQQLYWIKGDNLDRCGILADLKPNQQLEFLFSSVADKFHIIDNTQQAPVIVRYGESPSLIEQLKRSGPKRGLLRKLQRYVVNLPRHQHQMLLNSADIQEIHPGLFVQAYDGIYHKDLGLLGDDPVYCEPEVLMI